MSTTKTLTLSNGLEMPAVGFGCALGNWSGGDAWQGFAPEEGYAAFPAALRAGFTHFDGALFYGTHKVLAQTLGQQFAAGTLKRSDLWITTKVGHPQASLGHVKLGHALDWSAADVKEEVRKQIEMSLDDLTVGYVDLLLMHWPGVWGSTDAVANRKLRKEIWEVFEEYHKLGKAKAIGVSNFHKHHLEALIEDTTVKPMVNQIEVSPYITQCELVQYCQSQNIVVEAWGPFGSGATGVLADPVVKGLAEKTKKNVGQVVLRWLYQKGLCSLPKSSNEARMKGNLDIFDFELSKEDMDAITALNKDQSSVSQTGTPGSDIA